MPIDSASPVIYLLFCTQKTSSLQRELGLKTSNENCLKVEGKGLNRNFGSYHVPEKETEDQVVHDESEDSMWLDSDQTSFTASPRFVVIHSGSAAM